MKTFEIRDDLEILARCALRISTNTQERGGVSWSTMMASLVFSRLVLNAISVLRLIPGSRYCQPVDGLQLWDLPSAASLSRNLVEAFFVLHYFIEQFPDEEAKLRELVWRYHEVSERHKMLREALPQSPGVADLQERATKLRKQVESLPAFRALTNERKRRILNGEAAKLRTNEQLCVSAGVNHGYYNMLFKYGSNHTHSSPFCFTQMDSFRANGVEEQMDGMFWTALEAGAGFLAAAISDFLKLFPDQDQTLSEEERFRLMFWGQILNRGPASLVPKAKS